jgi:hypothetical protein
MNDDCDESGYRDEDDDNQFELPPLAALYQKNSDEHPTIVAMFRDPREANKYLDDYRKLEEDEFVTLQTPCCNEPGVFHILACIRATTMEVCEVEPGRLAAVPKELAPMYGDQWVTKGGES